MKTNKKSEMIQPGDIVMFAMPRINEINYAGKLGIIEAAFGSVFRVRIKNAVGVFHKTELVKIGEL